MLPLEEKIFTREKDFPMGKKIVPLGNLEFYMGRNYLLYLMFPWEIVVPIET